MRSVVITGGSRGIGAAAVRRFCAEGDRVTFFFEKNRAAAQALADETGARAVCCDVADEGAVRAAFAELTDLDLLINNAGVAHYGLISEITPDEWRRLFAVNVDGVYHCVRAALPFFLRKQQGCVLNVASVWGQVGASCEAAYSATKGAVIALSKALAQELAPSGIRVNAVAPGVIDTDMCACLDAETKTALAAETPLGRLGTPQDIADALLYLANAPFVTGQVLAVNGGFSIT